MTNSILSTTTLLPTSVPVTGTRLRVVDAPHAQLPGSVRGRTASAMHIAPTFPAHNLNANTANTAHDLTALDSAAPPRGAPV